MGNELSWLLGWASPRCSPHSLYGNLNSVVQGVSVIRHPPPLPQLQLIQVTILQKKIYIYFEATYFLVHPVVILIVSTRPVFQVRGSVFGAV